MPLCSHVVHVFQHHVLTVRVQLVCVGRQSAVVPVVRYSIVVVVVVACIPFAILVVVSLVWVGHVGAVVLVVLMAVFIDVLVVIALVSNQVIIYVRLMSRQMLKQVIGTFSAAADQKQVQILWAPNLVRVVQQGAVVTLVTNTVHVSVFLVGVVNIWAVVVLIQDPWAEKKSDKLWNFNV